MQKLEKINNFFGLLIVIIVYIFIKIIKGDEIIWLVLMLLQEKNNFTVKNVIEP